MKKMDILLQYGKGILESEQFIDAQGQTHHLCSDVASHSINTALFCIIFYKILTLFHIKVNLPVLVVAALAHDLGILGRKTKFSSNHECLRKHPEKSVITLQEMIPDIDPAVCEAIASHMYPIGSSKPVSKEAWLLTLADKCAACTDFFRHYVIPSDSNNTNGQLLP